MSRSRLSGRAGRAGRVLRAVLCGAAMLLPTVLAAELRSMRVPIEAPALPDTEAVRGSWQGQIARLSIALQGRDTYSDALSPPLAAQGRRLAHVRWQFRISGASYLPAWLCHPQRCVPLHSAVGVTRALDGLDAGQPLRLRFRRLPGMPVVELHDLQVLAHYR